VGVLAAYRTVAGNRNLVRLFFGEFVSGIGDWLYLVALLVIVYRETSDPVLLGLIGGARILPYIGLSVPAGFIIDRYDRRLILLLTDLIRGAAMVGLAAVAWLDGPVWLIMGLAIGATCFAVFFRPAIGAYLPSLTRDEGELGPANSIFATLGEVSFIIGPAIAGIIIAATDLAWAFAINAVTFAVVAAVLWTLPPNHPRHDPSDGAASEEAPKPQTTINVRSLVRPIAGMAILDVVAGFMWGGLSVVLVILAVDRLGAGEDATGYLWAAVGVGGVVGAVASGGAVLRPSLAPAMLIGASVLGFSASLLPAMAALGVTATGALIGDVVTTTVFQRIVPDAIRGRTLGALQTVTTLTYALGAFLMPILLVNVGAAVLFPIGGAAIIGTSLVTLVLVGPHFRRAVDPALETMRRVSRLPLFAGVPPAALEGAVEHLIPIDVGAGAVVISEGDPADRFYIIEEGQFAVDQRDPGTGLPRRLRVMGPDEVFGELGLMRNAPRSATVTAASDGRLLALERDDFLALLNVGPEISARMLDRYRASAAPPT